MAENVIVDSGVDASNSFVKKLWKTVPWIWDGVIARDAVTLLSAPEKTGKTTLLSLLLDRRREGGQLLGRAVRPGRTLLWSEESLGLWSLRQPPLDFGSELKYHDPTGAYSVRGSWRCFIDHLNDLGKDCYDLVVIDTVMTFLPSARNNYRRLGRALDDLRLVAYQSAGILLLHQACTVRTRSRTRCPLTALADIIIDMHIPHGSRFSRRRQFHGVGRYPGTLQHVAAELNPEGTDYLLLPDDELNANGPDGSLGPALETLRQLLSETPGPLTRQEILSRWPENEPPPRADSLWRTLARGCELGLLVRSGAGNRAEAFRYGVARRQAG
ncbi:MAG: AAA family ATPase [Planctomycetes bacterium]|nr:AAA family ATPase [Planctomycetota bacterium]